MRKVRYPNRNLIALRVNYNKRGRGGADLTIGEYIPAQSWRRQTKTTWGTEDFQQRNSQGVSGGIVDMGEDYRRVVRGVQVGSQ
jgi:hypothetical protein